MIVGFVGFGKMGQALARGAVAAKALRPSHVVAYDHHPAGRKKIKAEGFRSATSAQDVVDQSDLVFLCVKPQQMQEVVESLTPKRKCFVSIAAGIPLSYFEKSLGDKTAVIRVMPNTPALLRGGMSVISTGRWAKSAHVKAINKILLSVGDAVQLPEKHMDVVTALSGSGPAYIFYLTEALAKRAQTRGLSEAVAIRLARQTVFGAGLMLKNSPLSAGELRVQVTSKGGTTEAALRKFESLNFSKIVGDGLDAAARRSKELSRFFS